MFTEENSEDYVPITVIGKFPIYATELLIIIHVASMIFFALWAAISGQPLGGTFLDLIAAYSPKLIVEQFHIWRLVSYSIQNYPSIWFAIGMLMLWWFGREVEKFYGRRNFLIAYAALVLIPAVVGVLPFFRFSLIGPQQAHFAIFIMFAATYPSVLLLFNIQAKWLAWAYLAIYTLVHLAARDLNGLALLWLTAFLGYGMTRYLGRGEWLPERVQEMLPTFGKPKFTVVKSEPVDSNSDDPVSLIDPILEKIARKGLSSLSAKEHAALRAASGVLQKKGGS